MQLVVMSEFVSERFLCSVVEDIKRMIERERERERGRGERPCRSDCITSVPHSAQRSVSICVVSLRSFWCAIVL